MPAASTGSPSRRAQSPSPHRRPTATSTATPDPDKGGTGGTPPGGTTTILPPVLFEGGGPPAATCAKSSVRFGDVEAIAACFSPKGRANVATGRVRVNGLDIVPSAGAEIEIDPEAADDPELASCAGARRDGPALRRPARLGPLARADRDPHRREPDQADPHPGHRDGHDGRPRPLPDRGAAADRHDLRALRRATRRGVGREPAAPGDHRRRRAAHGERPRALARHPVGHGHVDPDRHARSPHADTRLRACRRPLGRHGEAQAARAAAAGDRRRLRGRSGTAPSSARASSRATRSAPTASACASSASRSTCGPTRSASAASSRSAPARRCPASAS